MRSEQDKVKKNLLMLLVSLLLLTIYYSLIKQKKGTFFQAYPNKADADQQVKNPLFEIEEISDRFQEVYGADDYEKLQDLFTTVDLEGSSSTMHAEIGTTMSLLRWIEYQIQEIKICKDYSKNLVKERLTATITGKKIELNASIFIWKQEYHILLQFSTDEYYKDELNSMKKGGYKLHVVEPTQFDVLLHS